MGERSRKPGERVGSPRAETAASLELSRRWPETLQAGVRGPENGFE